MDNPKDFAAYYFLAAKERAKFYSAESRLKVEKIARASMKFPSEKEHDDEKNPKSKSIIAALEHASEKMGEAGSSIENTSFGL